MGIPYGNDSLCILHYEHIGRVFFEFDRNEEIEFMTKLTRKANRERPAVGVICTVVQSYRTSDSMSEFALALVNIRNGRCCGWLASGAYTEWNIDLDMGCCRAVNAIKKMKWEGHSIHIEITEITASTDGWYEGIGRYNAVRCEKEGWWTLDTDLIRKELSYKIWGVQTLGPDENEDEDYMNETAYALHMKMGGNFMRGKDDV
ncbi:hypothetical protein BJ508DRAFT_310339 [Ascobolus immersus RN42]|uniref:Uncharacterized protein n=1 Tax=Ascobolus immersus RN42 TaxID=1160509 RepID=A0A3N4HZA5_ASCIM|nr:hypothetical protein BJ508DRAFT_310339 [Ascobolus immersus RN42]